ncbi:PREDICTED: chloride channel protein CLC-e [Tarenaya hassleriana]|uniref:chloride channel protein CLC-e n=1 Tax=Tarenaya hassleriana TaxID=28532 RepID=UPI00053C2C07|nr:PREDICTED: chloride channel protein CLC-e [Tarenaya hassleriana]XP_010530980.1 PREDICTED: chloride channel protein CLC-e [Tarenaya hassleriana]
MDKTHVSFHKQPFMAAALCPLRFPASRRRFSSFSPIPIPSSPFVCNAPLPLLASNFPPLKILPPHPGFLRLRRSPAAREDDQEDVGSDKPPPEGIAVASACLVGVLTGIGVVLFNNCVHIIRDFFWDGIPDRGASWLREEPIGSIWPRVILVPTFGALMVSVLNQFRASIGDSGADASNLDRLKAVLRPFLKTVAACVTLGTGNSLGPEGPSVEIGSSIAKGVNSLLKRSPQSGLSLVAAGSASGISSGFNAAVAGCFFAVESVLWPSPTDPSMSLTNTTSMVILSAVTASVVSEVGLGSQPAFKVPEYDFRSPGELPLYLLLGALCGLVSLALSRCTSSLTAAVDNLNKDAGIPKAVFPVMGGFTVGVIALAYPEVLYWGFENVDILLESRPFVKGLSADLLLQLVAVKIGATALCRASGLVGGYYAPSLFIGAATGMAYGKFIGLALAQTNPEFHLSILEVASPQAYGLVGMAATLAGVCQVPLTSVLLLFELTQDYRIVFPLLGAVGMSSWITSGRSKRQETRDEKNIRTRNSQVAMQSQASSDEESSMSNLCEVESSLCIEDSLFQSEELEKNIFVSEAMRTRYVTVMMGASLKEAVTLMLIEKQSCALIVDSENILLGLLTLSDIQDFGKAREEGNKGPEEISVYEICSLNGGKCNVRWTVTPDMDLLSAQKIMDKHKLSHVPVVSGSIDAHRMLPVGLLDRECITITRKALATRIFLG